MERFNRFLAKYYLPIYVICSVLWIALYYWTVDYLKVLSLILMWCSILLTARFLGSRWLALLKKPMEILDDTCDPYPYMEELQRQNNYSGPWTLKYNRVILQAGALMRVGSSEEAYALLLPLQEKLFQSQQPRGLQTIYCDCLANVCRALDRAEEAEYWHAKRMELLAKVKNKRIQQKFAERTPMYMAHYHTFRKEYEISIQFLQQQKPKNKYEQVSASMVYARNAVAMGETEKAKEALTFVVENGNKLYIASQARQMLAELENTAEK